jgi:hypothetical protein
MTLPLGVRLYLLPTLSILLTSCGALQLGGGQGVNDAVPTGTVIAFGNLIAQNGNTASGTVQIYRSSSCSTTCDHIVRVQNLNVTSSVPVTLVVTLSTGYSTYRPQLRFLNGTQNYTYTGVSSSVSWVQVALHPFNLIVGANDIAVANLQTP